MDRFLIKWYFDYCKGGEFYMVPQKFRKNLTRHSKSLSKPDFPFCNYRFLLVLYIECYDFDRNFECLAKFFFWIFLVPYKISHLCDYKNTIRLKIYTCLLSEITIYNFPTWPGCPCICRVRPDRFFHKRRHVFCLVLLLFQWVLILSIGIVLYNYKDFYCGFTDLLIAKQFF